MRSPKPSTNFSPTLSNSLFVTAALGMALALAAAGCAGQTPANTSAANADSGLDPTSRDLVPAQDWSMLEIGAYGAKTTIDDSGHLHTDHNYCNQPGDAVFGVSEWNALVTRLNQLVTNPPLAKPRCWESPRESKFYNPGTATLVISRTQGSSAVPVVTRRTLFEFKNAEVCTTISDPTLADAMMTQLETLILDANLAEATSCPNYRPPGT